MVGGAPRARTASIRLPRAAFPHVRIAAPLVAALAWSGGAGAAPWLLAGAVAAACLAQPSLAALVALAQRSRPIPRSAIVLCLALGSAALLLARAGIGRSRAASDVAVPVAGVGALALLVSFVRLPEPDLLTTLRGGAGSDEARRELERGRLPDDERAQLE